MEVSHLGCETGNKVPARHSLASGPGTTCGTLGHVWVSSGLALPSSTGISHRMHFLSFVDGFENFCQGPETVGAAQLCAGRDENGLSVQRRSSAPAGTCHKALQMGVFFSCSGRRRYHQCDSRGLLFTECAEWLLAGG